MPAITQLVELSNGKSSSIFYKFYLMAFLRVSEMDDAVAGATVLFDNLIAGDGVEVPSCIICKILVRFHFKKESKHTISDLLSFVPKEVRFGWREIQVGWADNEALSKPSYPTKRPQRFVDQVVAYLVVDQLDLGRVGSVSSLS